MLRNIKEMNWVGKTVMQTVKQSEGWGRWGPRRIRWPEKAGAGAHV